MYWIGSQAAIEAANQAATAIVLQFPEFFAGNAVPPVTTTWATAFRTPDGQWAIPALLGLSCPDNCTLVAYINWPSAAD